MEPLITSREIIHAAEMVTLIMEQAADATLSDEEREAMDARALALLDSLAQATPEKLDALRAVCARLDGETLLLQQEVDGLRGRIAANKASVERCKGLATDILQSRRAAGMEPKIKTTAHSYWLQTSCRVEGPSDPLAWPEAFRRIKVEADKAAAKKALEADEPVPGIQLVQEEGVRWR